MTYYPDASHLGLAFQRCATLEQIRHHTMCSIPAANSIIGLARPLEAEIQSMQ